MAAHVGQALDVWIIIRWGHFGFAPPEVVLPPPSPLVSGRVVGVVHLPDVRVVHIVTQSDDLRSYLLVRFEAVEVLHDLGLH